MTERVRSRTGAPTRWAGAVPDDADPMGGRHVLDQDAGMTPIFTTLRRGAWRGPRPQDGRALRSVPDPVEQFHRDPLTAPIPVIPAPVSAVSPVAPVSSTEATAWWGLPVVADRGPVPDHATYEPASYGSGSYEVAPYDAGSYDAGSYDTGSYAAHHDGSYDPGYESGYDSAHDPGHDSGSYAAYDDGSYVPAPYVPAPYDQAAYEPPLYGPPPVHDPVPYQPVAYEPAPYASVHHLPRHEPRPYDYDPLTDTGRHHRRLAPAGW